MLKQKAATLLLTLLTMLLPTVSSADEPAECLSNNPAMWPAPAKPYFMLAVDTSASMTASATGANSCGYPVDDRLGHARCAIKNTVMAFAGQANFGMAHFAMYMSGCTSCYGSCSYSCFEAETSGGKPCEGCGPEPDPGVLFSATRAGANIVVPMPSEIVDPSSTGNIDDLLSWSDNNCAEEGGAPPHNIELFAQGGTPLNGMLRDMHRYFSNSWTDPDGNVTYNSPLGTEAEGERPCRSVNVILITDGNESCDNLLDPQLAALNLYNGFVKDGITWRVKTHVIGFGVEVGISQDLLKIAIAGGTAEEGDTLPQVNNEEQLAQVLSDIIASALKPEICNNEDDNCNGCTDEGYLHYCNVDQDCCPWGGNPAVRDICEKNYLESIGKDNPEGDRSLLPCTSLAERDDPLFWLCYDPRESCDFLDNNCVFGADENVLKCGSPERCPTEEICNGIDDDCNGQVDEFVCGECIPSEEICDGCDNDCDGIVDNPPDGGFPEPACGQDTPANCVGKMLCRPEQTVPTKGTCVLDAGYECNNKPEPETCDGEDNDCNGVVDDNVISFSCEPPSNPPDMVYDGDSQCRMGATVCIDTVDECQGGAGPGTEVCDAIDNDCDGFIDEKEDIDILDDQCRKARGICEDGWWRCVDNGSGAMAIECCTTVTFENICIPPQGPELEVCNGLDDDCDGKTDEDGDIAQAGMPCGKDVGVCEAGRMKCVCDDEVPPNCEVTCVGETPPGDEVCSGFDDDCDGLTDEDLPLGAACNNSPTGTAQGICEDGFYECVNGDWPCNGISPSGEVCNNLDDDCDGMTDENLAVDCPKGSICVQGECREECIGEEMSCPAGTRCEWFEDDKGKKTRVCVSDVCKKGSDGALECVSNPFWCDEGHEPPCRCDAVQGKCVGLCDGVSCPEGKVCIPRDGTCQYIAEECWATGCPVGEKCSEGACVEDPCSSRECEEGEYCNNEGACVSPCVDSDCPAGCYEGECVEDPCAGIWCDLGSTCDKETGTCIQDESCMNVVCEYYEVCEGGQCVGDPCWNIKCPNGMRCIEGACYQYDDSIGDVDVDTDADTDADTDIDTGSGTDDGTDTDTAEGPDGGPPSKKISQVLATGRGGCLCTSAPGQRGRSGLSDPIAAWIALILVALRFSSRQRRRLYITVLSMALPLWLVGCKVEPYDFVEGDTSSGAGDVDTDGDRDTDSDGGGGTDDTEGCQIGAKDDDCDGQDDDCDGATDEDVDLQTNPNHCGECTNKCEYDHAFGNCKGGICEIGQCAAYWWNVNEDPKDGCEYYCKPMSVDKDRCNGVDLGDGAYKAIDDDCDGDMDEDSAITFATNPQNCGRCGNVCRFINATAKCESGVCKMGKCLDGFHMLDGDDEIGCKYECAETSETESCNGNDDDCDGNIDLSSGNPPADAVGPCNIPKPPPPHVTSPCVAGSLACVNGMVQCQDSVGPTAPIDGCGDDSNCDGILDNQPDLSKDPANCGTCGNDCYAGSVNSLWSCQGGKCTYHGCKANWYDLNGDQKCDYYCTTATGAERCNGIDDDCDGDTDEDVPPPSPVTVCGVSPAATRPECTSEVAVACDNGTWKCTFPPGVCNPSCREQEEICDSLDNNCNAGLNENAPRYNKACASDDGLPPPGHGACRTTGVYVCDGPSATRCNAEPLNCEDLSGGCEEKCDGIDNDCDGIADEYFNNKGDNADNFVKPSVTRVADSLWIFTYETSRPSATEIVSGFGNGYHCSTGCAPLPDAPPGEQINKTKGCSSQNRIPWFNVSPVEVEQTCNAIGGRICSTSEWQRACQVATMGCKWGYYPREDDGPDGGVDDCNSMSSEDKYCNLGEFDFDPDAGSDQDGLLPSASGDLQSCWSDWSSLLDNSPEAGVFDITGNLREITSGNTGYPVMGGSFVSVTEESATCSFDFYTVNDSFRLFDTGFRCCFDSDPTK